MRAMKILALAIILAASGCARGDKLSHQPAQAAAQIQIWVPVGTSVADAQRIMEQHQFKCSVMTNASFGDLGLTNADFLFCGRSDPDSLITPVAIQGWRVALILTNKTVSGLRVSTDLTGP